MVVKVDFSVEQFLSIAENHPGSQTQMGLSFAECAEQIIGKPIHLDMHSEMFYVECSSPQEAVLFKLQWL